MYKRILLLCDLEGVNHVVGVPYEGLAKGTAQWEIARRQAALELNAAAYLARLRSQGIEAAYPDDEILGKDAHTVRASVVNLETFVRCI